MDRLFVRAHAKDPLPDDPFHLLNMICLMLACEKCCTFPIFLQVMSHKRGVCTLQYSSSTKLDKFRN